MGKDQIIYNPIFNVVFSKIKHPLNTKDNNKIKAVVSLQKFPKNYIRIYPKVKKNIKEHVNSHLLLIIKP